MIYVMMIQMSDLLLYPGTTTPPDSLVTDGHLHLLWPKPQKLVQKEGQHFIAKDELIVLVAATPAENLHSICDCWHRQVMVIRDLGLDLVVEPFINGVPQHPHIICEINTRLFTKLESCRITVTDKMIKIQASDVTGMFYAMHTTLQLIRLCGKDGIPPLQIQDWPSLRDRGVLLDLSKGRIPTLESLRTFIEILAGLKVNQVQLYMRFKSLREADTPWQLPYSPSEILNVSWLCKHYHMMLAPVIDVAPSVSYDDLPQLYNSFLQFSHCFTNASVIGVGPRLSSLLVDTDNGHLRLDDVHRLLPVSTNQIVQLCAFVFHDSLDSLTQFPFSTMVMEYGFQANYDFEKLSKLYSENGVPFSVMPGTAAWNSLAGCPEAAVGNMHSAITSAASHGALGMVAAHWAGVGHMTHQCISWPGFLTAAGLAWNCNIRCDFLHANLSELLNQILVDEAGTAGQVIVELGRAETYILRCARNQQGNDDNDLPAEKGSTLYQLLSHPDQVSLENLTMEAFQRAMRHIRKCQSELSKCRMLCEQGPEIQAELQVTADLMLSACRIGRALVYVGRNPGGQQTGYAVINLGVANLPATHKTDLANRMLTQIDTYQRVWQMRQLETSLADSVAILNNSLKQFLPDQVMPEMAAPVLNGEVED